MSPLALTTAEQLHRELSDPVRPAEIAKFLSISVGTVYESMRRFDAARLAGDIETARRQIPCLHFGGVKQPNGTFRGGRYRVPRQTFIEWYTSVGIGGDALDEMYGEGAA
jgi:hypothetical protein